MSKQRYFLLLFTLLLGVLPTSATATQPTSTLGTGDQLAEITLEDQHGQPHTVPPDARLLLFTADKGASNLLQDYLEQQESAFLQQREAYYVADIHRMPGLVTRMFALPSMRERPYTILLAQEATAIPPIPHQDGQVTVLHLDNRRIAHIGYATSLQELAQLINRPQP